MNHPGISGWWMPIVWSVYSIWLCGEVWLILRDRRKVRGAQADRGSRSLLAAVLGLCITSAFAFGFSFAHARIPVGHHLLLPLGIGIMCAGMALRLWSVLTLGRHFRTSVFVQEGHTLVEVGPYRLLRHPSYSGMILTLLGLGVAIGNWLSLAVVVIGPLAAFVWRIHIEETALASHFRQTYDLYRNRTWSLVPWVW